MKTRATIEERRDAASPRPVDSDPSSEATSFPNLTDEEFSLLQALIDRETGIHLNPSKRALLASRLSRRLRALELPTFSAYYRLLMEEGSDELERMIDRVTTNETSFFREPRQFALLQQQVLPRWREAGSAGQRRRQLRVWSAGCSTGEEPYSIAMLLLDCFPPGSGWQLEILGSDISCEALDRARVGVWPARQESQIPPSYLKRFMLKGHGSQEGNMKAGPEIRRLIRFQHLNLVADHYPLQGGFDLLFCRNVLIYFDHHTQRRVIHQLLDYLAANGLLLLGHAESPFAVTQRLRSVIPTVYAANRRAAPPSSDAADEGTGVTR